MDIVAALWCLLLTTGSLGLPDYGYTTDRAILRVAGLRV